MQKVPTFASTKTIQMNARTIEINRKIKESVHRADPTARVILYGSRARGDERPDSDWDVLIIVDRERSDMNTFMNVGNPLYDLADDNGIEINPVIYTTRQWEDASPSLFRHNVLQEGILL